MRKIFNIKNRIMRTLVLTLPVVLVMVAAPLFNVSGAASADVVLNGGGQNCDSNAVMYCGATSASQLVNKYNTGDGQNSIVSTQNIYNSFGITSADIQAMPSTAVAGSVTKSGDVYVGNQLVATNALTAGRQYIAGSTTRTYGGTTFYARPPSISFLSNSLTAYVVMNNGRFQFAILSVCGNPVVATPVTPPPAPTGTCTNLTLTQAVDNPRQVTAQVAYTTQNGATLSGVNFAWGDNTNSSVSGSTTNASHLYTSDGSYTVKATLTFSGSQPVASANCQAPITVQTITPVCTMLNIQTSGNTATITKFSYSNNNGSGTFQNATINWGDNSAPVTTSNVVGTTHTYTGTGPYTVIASANFMLNGKQVTETSPGCQQVVSFTAPTTTPPTTPAPVTPAAAPQKLVNTGPGSVVGLFMGSSLLGTIIYRRFMKRYAL